MITVWVWVYVWCLNCLLQNTKMLRAIRNLLREHESLFQRIQSCPEKNVQKFLSDNCSDHISPGCHCRGSLDQTALRSKGWCSLPTASVWEHFNISLRKALQYIRSQTGCSRYPFHQLCLPLVAGCLRGLHCETIIFMRLFAKWWTMEAIVCLAKSFF